MAKSVDPTKLVSVAEIAKERGYSPKYFSRLAAQGKIEAWHIGNTWISTRKSIDKYLANKTGESTGNRRPKKRE